MRIAVTACNIARVDRLTLLATATVTEVAGTRRLTRRHDRVAFAQSVDTAVANSRQLASVDWCARDAITGEANVASTFVLGRASGGASRVHCAATMIFQTTVDGLALVAIAFVATVARAHMQAGSSGVAARIGGAATVVTEILAVVDGLAQASAARKALIACALVGTRALVGAAGVAIAAAVFEVAVVDWYARGSVALVSHVTPAVVLSWSSDAALGLEITQAVEICTVVYGSTLFACAVVTVVAHAGVFSWARACAFRICSTAVNTCILGAVVDRRAAGAAGFIRGRFALTCFAVFAKRASSAFGDANRLECGFRVALDTITFCAGNTAAIRTANSRRAEPTF